MNKCRLKPNEYVSVSSLETLPNTSDFYPLNGLVFTKDGKEIIIQTPITVDNGCEIEVSYRDNGIGRVKYLKSTPRRKYYVGLRWYIIILELITIILVGYEININHNYLVEGSTSYNLLGPLLCTWIVLVIPILRNSKGLTKYIMNIFGYFILLINTVMIIEYIIDLL